MRKLDIQNTFLTGIIIFLTTLFLKNAFCYVINRRVIALLTINVIIWIVLLLFSKKYSVLLKLNTDRLIDDIKFLFSKKDPIIKKFRIVVIVFICSLLISTVVASVYGKSINYILFLMILSMLFIFLTAWKYRKNLFEKMHIVFFCTALVTGSFYIFCMPAEVVMSWDEHIHFSNVMNIVDNIGGYSVASDSTLSSKVYVQDGDFFSKEARIKENNEYNNLYKNRKVEYPQSFTINSTTISYLPYAIGVILGRGFAFPYTLTFRIAKLVNLLFFDFLITLSIKISKHNKLIFAGIGILPTMMFMASSFSYDPWVLSFTLLGYSIYQNCIEDGKITLKQERLVCTFLFLGILVKAVYFPIMFPLFAAPSNIFSDKKEASKFKIRILLTMLLLLLSFALPMLINTGSRTDIRGGSDVNSAEQVKFILNNPLKYCYIYLRYLFTFYLIPQHSYGFIQSYAYLGNGITNCLPTILLFGLVLFAPKNRYSDLKNSVLAIVGCILSLTLVVTALYVSFTPVGYDTVNGCQFRYLIPLLYPVLSCFKGGYIKMGKYAGQYGTLVILFMATTMIAYMGNYMLIRF